MIEIESVIMIDCFRRKVVDIYEWMRFKRYLLYVFIRLNFESQCESKRPMKFSIELRKIMSDALICMYNKYVFLRFYDLFSN